MSQQHCRIAFFKAVYFLNAFMSSIISQSDPWSGSEGYILFGKMRIQLVNAKAGTEPKTADPAFLPRPQSCLLGPDVSDRFPRTQMAAVTATTKHGPVLAFPTPSWRSQRSELI